MGVHWNKKEISKNFFDLHGFLFFHSMKNSPYIFCLCGCNDESEHTRIFAYTREWKIMYVVYIF